MRGEGVDIAHTPHRAALTGGLRPIRCDTLSNMRTRSSFLAARP